MLNPDADIEDHKNRQLAHLAVMNGSIVDVKCRICQQSGHQIWNCPSRQGMGYKAAVVCEICGESSHITKDCKRLIGSSKEEQLKKLDAEYEEFMRGLMGDGPSTMLDLNLKQLTGPKGSVPVVSASATTSGAKPDYHPLPAPHPFFGAMNPMMSGYVAVPYPYAVPVVNTFPNLPPLPVQARPMPPPPPKAPLPQNIKPPPPPPPPPAPPKR